MKKILFLFILTISCNVLGEDISDFKIEGMYIGESLLDYYSEEEIFKNKSNASYNLKEAKFYSTTFRNSNFENYEAVEIFLKSNDNNYIIYSIRGGIFYENKIEECKVKKKEILNEMKNFLKMNFVSGELKHQFDETGKSIQYQSYFLLEDNSNIRVECYQWSKEVKKQYNWTDNLSVSLVSSEVQEWINNNYK